MARQIRLPRLSEPHLRRRRVAPARPGNREQRDGAEAIISRRRRGRKPRWRVVFRAGSASWERKLHGGRNSGRVVARMSSGACAPRSARA